jgi:hypothetical protein
MMECRSSTEMRCPAACFWLRENRMRPEVLSQVTGVPEALASTLKELKV